MPEARLPQQTKVVLPAAPRVLPSRAAPEIAGAEVPHLILPALDAARLRQERDQRQQQHQQENDLLQRARRPTRDTRLPDAQRQEIGINRDLRLSEADGAWFHLPSARVWMVDITSPASLTTRLHVTNFALPTGMKLYISAPGTNQEPFEFEDKGPFANGDFWSPPVTGETIHLELLDESNPDGPVLPSLPFQITGLGHVYEDIRSFAGTPQACELDATCYPDWSGSGDSVARILFSDAYYIYACSATLLNNASGDFSPLLLTASHCINSDALAQTIGAYFFYKSSVCNGYADENTAYLSNYATFLAATPIGESDTAVVQMLGWLPTAAVWAAWTTADPYASETVTGIHHPVASYRHIAFGMRTYDESAAKYNVIWNLGITEHGSSGSPLFNSNHQVVGQLHGGYSSCTVSGPDDYGKLNAAYDKLVGSDGREYLEQGLADDNLANNSRDVAHVVNVPATLNNLVVKRLAEDWFKVSVAANQGFSVSLPYAANSYANLEVYQGSDSSPMYSGPTLAQVAAYSGNTDFFVHVYLDSGPYYTAVRSSYNISFTPWQPTQTAPAVTTQTPNASFNSATMKGYLYMPGNPVLTSWYEWGSDPTLAVHAATPTISSNYLPAVTVTGLTPGTQYYARLAVSWLGSTLYGGVVPFQTQAIGSTNYYPAPDSVGVLPQGNLSFYAYGTSADVYFGTSTQPPFLGNYIPDSSNNSVSANAGTLNPSTRYYWRIVANYQSIANSSVLLSFDTENALRTDVLANTMGFPSISVVKNSDEQAITISSLLNFQERITSVATTGDFTQRNDCVGTLVGHWTGTSYSTCTVYVTFRPTDLGVRAGTLVLTTDLYPMPLMVQLSGTGTTLVMVLNRPTRPARGVSTSASPFEIVLPARTSARTTCSVRPNVANCTLVRRESSTLITLAPVPRTASQRKTAVRRTRTAIARGRYVVSIIETGGRAHFDIPVEVR